MIEQGGGWDAFVQDDSLRLTPRSQKPHSQKLEQTGPAYG